MLLRCNKIAKCRVAYGSESNGLNRVFTNKVNCGKIFGGLFITSSSSHFLNKIDFEQYILKHFPFIKNKSQERRISNEILSAVETQ